MLTRSSTIDEVLTDLRSGKMVLLCDPEPAPGMVSLTVAAEFASPETINFMACHGRGLICLALPPERCDALGLHPMTAGNGSQFASALTVSIEARSGLSTGISVHDRARTIQVAIDSRSGPGDLARPGHVFPLRTRTGGVLEQPGQAEAAVDLARSAGLIPAGVICAVLNEDGGVPGPEDLARFCRQHDLKMVTIAEVIMHRCRTDRLVERVVQASLPTSYGDFQAIGFRGLFDGMHYIAFVKGEVAGVDDVLVHVHSRCLAGDVFGSLRCDCASQLRDAMTEVEGVGRGVVVYLPEDEPDIGSADMWLGHVAANHGRRAVDARRQPIRHRDDGVVPAILADLGLTTIRLTSNSHDELDDLEWHSLYDVNQSRAEGVRRRRIMAIAQRRAECPAHTRVVPIGERAEAYRSPLARPA